MSDDASKEPIQPPKSFPKEKILKSVAKATAGTFPGVGAVLSEVVDLKYPDPEADDRKRWEAEVTTDLNVKTSEIETLKLVTSSHIVTLSDHAEKILFYMLKQCPDGLASKYTRVDEFVENFPDINLSSIDNAIGELMAYHMIERFKALGNPKEYRLKSWVYEQADEACMGYNTVQDAKMIAALICELDNASVREIDAKLGWPKRRLNPALRKVLEYISRNHISRELQPDYITAYFFMDEGERFKLRSFAKSS